MPVVPRAVNASPYKIALKSARIAELLKTHPKANISWGAYFAEPLTPKQADLGIAVAKKLVKRAVDRNALKRMIRELVWQAQTKTLQCDAVIKLRHAVGKNARGKLRQAELITLRSKIRDLI